MIEEQGQRLAQAVDPCHALFSRQAVEGGDAVLQLDKAILQCGELNRLEFLSRKPEELLIFVLGPSAGMRRQKGYGAACCPICLRCWCSSHDLPPDNQCLQSYY